MARLLGCDEAASGPDEEPPGVDVRVEMPPTEPGSPRQKRRGRRAPSMSTLLAGSAPPPLDERSTRLGLLSLRFPSRRLETLYRAHKLADVGMAARLRAMAAVLALNEALSLSRVDEGRRGTEAMYVVHALMLVFALGALVFSCVARSLRAVRRAGEAGAWLFAFEKTLELWLQHSEEAVCSQAQAVLVAIVTIVPLVFLTVLKLPWARLAVMQAAGTVSAVAFLAAAEMPCLAPLDVAILGTFLAVLMYVSAAEDRRRFLRSLLLEDDRAKLEKASNDAMRYIFHEVRVPFNAIYLGIEVLEEQPDELPGMLADMKSQAEMLRQTLDDVASFQKLCDGEIKLFPRPFSVGKLAHGVVWGHRVVAEDRGIVLRAAVDPGIPRYVVGDEQRLRQVLTNMVSNALKFTPRGGRVTVEAALLGASPAADAEQAAREGRLLMIGGGGSRGGAGSGGLAVRATTDKNGTPVLRQRRSRLCLRAASRHAVWVQFRVRDSGVGMPDEVKRRLFDPTLPMNPEQHEGEQHEGTRGSGLGLKICGKLVELHGGYIKVDSSPGSGTDFMFVVPVEPAAGAYGPGGAHGPRREAAARRDEAADERHRKEEAAAEEAVVEQQQQQQSEQQQQQQQSGAAVAASVAAADAIMAPPRLDDGAGGSSTGGSARSLGASAVSIQMAAEDGWETDESDGPAAGEEAAAAPSRSSRAEPGSDPAARGRRVALRRVGGSNSSGLGRGWGAHARSSSLSGTSSLMSRSRHSMSAGGLGGGGGAASPGGAGAGREPLHPSLRSVAYMQPDDVPDGLCFASPHSSPFRRLPPLPPSSSRRRPPAADAAAAAAAAMQAVMQAAPARTHSSSRSSTSTLTDLTASPAVQAGRVSHQRAEVASRRLHMLTLESDGEAPPAPLRVSMSATLPTLPPAVNEPATAGTAAPERPPSLPRPQRAKTDSADAPAPVRAAARLSPADDPPAAGTPAGGAPPSRARATKAAGGGGGGGDEALPSSARRSVLVVEDNRVNQKMMVRILKVMKFDVLTADNGLEAVHLLEGDEPAAVDMIFMDNTMPVMNGVDATARLREMGVRVPIVALTGNALMDDRERFLSAGVDAVLTKPASLKKLKLVMDQFMDRPQTPMQNARSVRSN